MAARWQLPLAGQHGVSTARALSRTYRPAAVYIGFATVTRPPGCPPPRPSAIPVADACCWCHHIDPAPSSSSSTTTTTTTTTTAPPLPPGSWSLTEEFAGALVVGTSALVTVTLELVAPVTGSTAVSVPLVATFVKFGGGCEAKTGGCGVQIAILRRRGSDCEMPQPLRTLHPWFMAGPPTWPVCWVCSLRKVDHHGDFTLSHVHLYPLHTWPWVWACTIHVRSC